MIHVLNLIEHIQNLKNSKRALKKKNLQKEKMMKTQKETLTPQNCYAYVIQETNVADRKRILITKDIKTFLQSCVRMFNNPKIVRILNQDGDTISNISEIEPMKEYYVTEIGEDFVDVRKATNVFSNQNIDEDQFQDLFLLLR